VEDTKQTKYNLKFSILNLPSMNPHALFQWEVGAGPVERRPPHIKSRKSRVNSALTATGSPGGKANRNNVEMRKSQLFYSYLSKQINILTFIIGTPSLWAGIKVTRPSHIPSVLNVIPITCRAMHHNTIIPLLIKSPRPGGYTMTMSPAFSQLTV
jgi:hypothetical protein